MRFRLQTAGCQAADLWSRGGTRERLARHLQFVVQTPGSGGRKPLAESHWAANSRGVVASHGQQCRAGGGGRGADSSGHGPDGPAGEHPVQPERQRTAPPCWQPSLDNVTLRG